MSVAGVALPQALAFRKWEDNAPYQADLFLSTSGAWGNFIRTITCAACPAGYLCALGASAAPTVTPCPGSTWCAVGSYAPTLCPAGSFAPVGSISPAACSLCPRGSYCPGGTNKPIRCPRWTASPPGATACSRGVVRGAVPWLWSLTLSAAWVVVVGGGLFALWRRRFQLRLALQELALGRLRR
jgi:hypothetical protein